MGIFNRSPISVDQDIVEKYEHSNPQRTRDRETDKRLVAATPRIRELEAAGESVLDIFLDSSRSDWIVITDRRTEKEHEWGDVYHGRRILHAKVAKSELYSTYDGFRLVLLPDLSMADYPMLAAQSLAVEMRLSPFRCAQYVRRVTAELKLLNWKQDGNISEEEYSRLRKKFEEEDKSGP